MALSSAPAVARIDVLEKDRSSQTGPSLASMKSRLFQPVSSGRRDIVRTCAPPGSRAHSEFPGQWFLRALPPSPADLVTVVSFR